jgi:hypothetical protein
MSLTSWSASPYIDKVATSSSSLCLLRSIDLAPIWREAGDLGLASGHTQVVCVYMVSLLSYWELQDCWFALSWQSPSKALCKG